MVDDRLCVTAALEERGVEIEEEHAEEHPEHTDVLVQLGNAYYDMKRFDKAIAWYEKALELEPRPEVLANLSLAYRMANDAEMANEYLRKAQILDPKRFGSIPPATELADAESGSGARP